MKFSTTAAALAALTSTASAAPLIAKRAYNDFDILNYALTLEHLEDTFYRQGLANYTQKMFASAGFDKTFYNNLMTISSDETTHVGFLTSAITAAGGSPVAACNYSFGTTTPAGFIALASILEGVGVSAYLGAAADIMNKDYLTAAGSILTVEARHSATIRRQLSLSPFASPFDTPLDFDTVYTLAAMFITSCPAGSSLPFTAFPTLVLQDAQPPVRPKSKVWLANPKGGLVQDKVFACWASVTGPVFSMCTISTDTKTCTTKIPQGLAGQTYVLLTDSATSCTDDDIIAGPVILEVGM